MSRITALFVVLIFSFQEGIGQQEYSKVFEDFGLWSSISLDGDISKKWTYKGTYAYRLKNNASELRTTYFQANINRDLKKKWDVGMAVRYSAKQNSQIFRFSPIVKKYIRFKPINVLYRFKADISHELFDARAEWESRIRNRFGVEYSRKKHDLKGGISVEWFHENDDHLLWANNIRYNASIQYKINKKFRIKTTFLVQQELNKAKPVRDYVIRWNVHYKL